MMKSNALYRRLAVLLMLFLLLALFTLPAFAETSGILGGVEAEILDKIDIEAPDFSGIASSLLTIRSLKDANEALQNYAPGVLMIVACIALLMTFFGYRALRFAILLAGFVGGWLVGTSIYSWLYAAEILAEFEPIPIYVPYIIFTAFGILAAFLATKIIRFGIFLSSAAATFFFLNSFPLFDALIGKLVTEDPEKTMLIARLVIALIVGGLALLLTRPVLIITTSAAGGMVSAITLIVITGTINPNLELAIGIVLAVIGMLVQFGAGRGKHRKRRT